MKKIIFYIVLVISFLGILLFSFGIINTMVSLKYETNNSTDCISNITSVDLCAAIFNLKILTITFGAVFIGLLIFRKKFIK